MKILLENGWNSDTYVLYPNAECFFKRFETPTQCHCNDDKKGLLVMIAVYAVNIEVEVEVVGELFDGTWIKIHQYALPKDIAEVLKIVPRLLVAWEAAATWRPE
jgi:hypothetical protein